MIINISIPQRSTAGSSPGHTGFRYETARIKILVELSGSTSDSTLTMNGTTINLHEQNVISGDMVRFGTDNSTGSLLIDLFLRSDFDGGDPRNPIFSGNRSRSLSLTTPMGTPTHFRMAVYCAASSLVSSSPYRRIDTYRPTVTTGSPSIPDDDRRLPLDIILVMDHSGSMAAEVNPGTSRLALLQQSLGLFLTAMSIEETSVEDDRAALVWFETTATTQRFTMNPWVRRGRWESVLRPAISAQTTAGMTAMGDGVSQGVKAWWDEEQARLPVNDPMLVLLTDGIQNAGHEIHDRPETNPDILDYFDLTDNGWHPLTHRPIPMQSIGVGAAAAYQGLLNDIGTQTGGQAIIEINPLNITETFVDTLIQVLKGNTLSLVRRDNRRIAANIEMMPPMAFTVVRDCPQLMFCMNWLGRINAATLDIVIFAPDGQPVTPTRREDQPFFTVQTIAKPQPGMWHVRVIRRDSAEGEESIKRPIDYFLSVLANEGAFSFTFDIFIKERVVGSEVRLLLDLAENGKPIELKQMHGTITLEVFSPKVSMGQVLHDSQFPSPGELADEVDLKDSASPLEIKLGYLQKRGIFKSFEHVKAEHSMTVSLDGTGGLPGWIQFKDGMFAFSFNEAQVSGNYRFRISLDIKTPQSGHIQRSESADIYLKHATIDQKMTKVYAQPRRPSKSHYIHIIPRDHFGNYWGPGYDHHIDLVIVAGNGTVKYQPNKNADGIYTFRVTSEPSLVSLVFQVMAFGKPIFRVPLSRLVDSIRPFPPIWHGILRSANKKIEQLRKTWLP